jgi:ferredoxin/uncharacterized pyridoxamine 5'-phosphate oxidase family protein
MMKIDEIYDKFDQIGCLTFATVRDDGAPETRIAHLFAYDEEGLYLRTMTVKPFCQQMRDNEWLSICGMSSATQVTHGENHLPNFEAGFTMKATGKVKEVPVEEIYKKAEKCELFLTGTRDYERYPDEVFFCLYNFWGEYYDFDFECESRDHKIVRHYFTYGGYEKPFAGMRINQDKCIKCGACEEKCASYNFHAAKKREDGLYRIDTTRCDACANCVHVCPVGAIEGIV